MVDGGFLKANEMNQTRWFPVQMKSEVTNSYRDGAISKSIIATHAIINSNQGC